MIAILFHPGTPPLIWVGFFVCCVLGIGACIGGLIWMQRAEREHRFTLRYSTDLDSDGRPITATQAITFPAVQGQGKGGASTPGTGGTAQLDSAVPPAAPSAFRDPHSAIESRTGEASHDDASPAGPATTAGLSRTTSTKKGQQV